MRKKLFTLKTLQKNLLLISGTISLLIGTIKEILTLFVPLKAREISGLVSTHVVPKIVHSFHAPSLLGSIKHWAFQHWNLVLIGVGVLVFVLILFLVDEVKEYKK